MARANSEFLIFRWIFRRRIGWPGTNYTFAHHESEEIGPRMPARIAKHTGRSPEDL